MKDYRVCSYGIWKTGKRVTARFRGAETFHPEAVHNLLDKRRVFAVDTESLKKDGALRTLLTTVRFHDVEASLSATSDHACAVPIPENSALIETLDGERMIHNLFDALFARPDYSQPAGRPSRTAQRRGGGRRRKERRYAVTNGRDGRRETIDPVVAVFFNLPYDIPRLLADLTHELRRVNAGADSYRFRVSDRFEIEVVRMIFEKAPQFEWYVRDLPAKRIIRILGVDLCGYWKCSLAEAAKAAGVAPKVDIESSIPDVFERPFEQFTSQEWELFKEYGLGDVTTTLELYHRTAELLVQIDPHVVKRTGVIPPSTPSAAIRILMARAFACHPEIKSWRRYPVWADQMGCDAYYGGNSFCARPGRYQRCESLDVKSMYPFWTANLPDPVTVRMLYVADQNGRLMIDGRVYGASRGFRLDHWRGRFGVLYVDGEGLDPIMPAFRVHDPDHDGRLRYVFGRFQNVAVTIPELVIGVLRGALRIDRIRNGVLMVGTADRSFLRSAITTFFKVKEDPKSEKPLSYIAKILANAGAYGKFVEVQSTNYLVAEQKAMPVFAASPIKTPPPRAGRNVEAETWQTQQEADDRVRELVSKSIAGVFANGGATEATYWGEAAPKDADAEAKRRAEAKREDAKTRFYKAFDGSSADSRTASTQAVDCYIDALELSGHSRKMVPWCSVAEYVAQHKEYRCGQHFMPLYAAQTTGAASAMVALMASCLGAVQGDTDSVHVPLPDSVRHADELPGWERYFDIMAQAGYPSPRLVDGRWVGGLDSAPNLGGWIRETDPSVESLFVQPKRYSHKLASGEYKQAAHGFCKHDCPEARAIRKDLNRTPEERKKRAKAVMAGKYHEALSELLGGREYTYTTRKSPRKLREAIVRGLPVGEFTDNEVTIKRQLNPNVAVGPDGWVRWNPMPEPEAEKRERVWPRPDAGKAS
jgi:hypothetical protein